MHGAPAPNSQRWRRSLEDHRVRLFPKLRDMNTPNSNRINYSAAGGNPRHCGVLVVDAFTFQFFAGYVSAGTCIESVSLG
jgi:hypothetical protein